MFVVLRPAWQAAHSIVTMQSNTVQTVSTLTSTVPCFIMSFFLHRYWSDEEEVALPDDLKSVSLVRSVVFYFCTLSDHVFIIFFSSFKVQRKYERAPVWTQRSRDIVGQLH